jgi:hypothetical protein
MRAAGESAIVAAYGLLFISAVYRQDWWEAVGYALLFTGAVLFLLDLIDD